MSNAPSAALRPYLCRHVRPLQRNAYIRFYTAVSQNGIHNESGANDSLWSSLTYKRRLRDLKALRPVNEDAAAFPSVLYPRPPPRKQRYPVVPIAQFRNKWDRLEKGKTAEGEPRFILQGTVYATHSTFVVVLGMLNEIRKDQIGPGTWEIGLS
jgi:hypothetical protein